MKEIFSRSERLIGEEGMKRLSDSKVAVFGVGGVGSFAAETLVRTGLGSIVLIDYDIIDSTNINRQIHATSKTVGMEKVQVMKDRLLEINPELEVSLYQEKYLPENKDKFDFHEYDYVIDAIDMISGKLSLIEVCKSRNIPIISAMGAGNKLDPTRLKVGDIYNTKECPLARVMRRELRKRAIDSLKVVWSDEKPKSASKEQEGLRKATPASVAFIPSVMGIIIGSEVIKDISIKEG